MTVYGAYNLAGRLIALADSYTGAIVKAFALGVWEVKVRVFN